jgi:hypothetical protein
MIIKKYSGAAWQNQSVKTTAADIYTSDAFTTSVFDSNNKLKPAYLPDSVFDSLYFNGATSNTDLRELSGVALGNASSLKRSNIGFYYVATAPITLNSTDPAVLKFVPFTTLKKGSFSTASNIITTVEGTDTTGLTVGMVVSGVGIPSSPVTTITSITSATTFTLSANTTAPGSSVTLSFQNYFSSRISFGEESNVYTRNFTLTANSPTVTGGDTSNLTVGMRVTGTGLPTTPPPTIATITSVTSFTLSANANTAGTNVALTFTPTNFPPSVNLEIGDWFIITQTTGLGTLASPYEVTYAIVNNTYELMKAATSSAAGAPGLVPAPLAGEQGLYLRGDGDWATPTNTTAITFGAGTATTGTNKISFLSRESSDITAAKYTLLKAGTNVSFTTNVAGEATISSTDTNTTYTFAEGSTDGAFSVTPSGGTASSVAIHGLGSAAYTASGDYAAASHVHGNIKNDGAIGTVASLPIITTTGGVLTTGSFGTTAGTFAEGNDSRLHTRSHTMTSTNDHTAGAWRVFYSNASGNVVELALGASGRVLKSNGTSSAPSWELDINDQYTAGTGLTLDQNEFSVDYPVYYDATTLPTSGVPTGAIGFLG